MKKLVWTVCALVLSTGMSSLYAVSLSEEPAKMIQYLRLLSWQ